MPERFWGIDTSNYRTSAAIYNAETGEWVNRGGLLTVPEGAIGLRQSDALFQHTVRLHEKIEALPQGEVRAIGVSTRPRAVEGSYMPCFLAGESVARPAAAQFAFRVRFLPNCLISRDISRRQRCRLASWICLTANFWRGTCPAARRELLHVKCGADGKTAGLPTCIGGTTDLCSRSAARSRGKSARSAVPVRRRTGRAGAYRRAGKGVQTEGKRV